MGKLDSGDRWRQTFNTTQWTCGWAEMLIFQPNDAAAPVQLPLYPMGEFSLLMVSLVPGGCPGVTTWGCIGSIWSFTSNIKCQYYWYKSCWSLEAVLIWEGSLDTAQDKATKPNHQGPNHQASLGPNPPTLPHHCPIHPRFTYYFIQPSSQPYSCSFPIPALDFLMGLLTTEGISGNPLVFLLAHLGLSLCCKTCYSTFVIVDPAGGTYFP